MRAKAICAVCAEAPTVRSHIIPRALFHDGRRAGRTMVLGGVESGYRVTQSGKWSSRILCAGHERKLAPCDDYGVSFCRSFAASSAQAGPRLLSNPAPGLLVDFAVASVWRMAAAISEGKPGQILGDNADLIEGRLFGPGDGCDPALHVEAFGLEDGHGRPLVFGLLPAPIGADRKSWHFIVSGLRFAVDLDPPAGAQGAVNQSTEIELLPSAPRHVEDVPGLRAALINLSKPRSRPERP